MRAEVTLIHGFQVPISLVPVVVLVGVKRDVAVSAPVRPGHVGCQSHLGGRPRRIVQLVFGHFAELKVAVER